MNNAIFVNLITLQSGVSGGAGEARDLDVWELILSSSPVVMLVLIILVAMSLICWFIIGAKVARLSKAVRESRAFLDLFWSPEEGNKWSADRLEAIYAQIKQFDASPVARVFHAGYVELARVASDSPGQGDLANIERSLRRTKDNEMTRLENFVPFLATTGSVGPFVGLFGTVWGIMNSFIGIRRDGSASLDTVAPGIAEALIATAIGLAAAIPAVMAYNYFVRRLRVIEHEVEGFSSDYLNIVRRHFLR